MTPQPQIVSQGQWGKDWSVVVLSWGAQGPTGRLEWAHPCFCQQSPVNRDRPCAKLRSDLCFWTSPLLLFALKRAKLRSRGEAMSMGRPKLARKTTHQSATTFQQVAGLGGAAWWGSRLSPANTGGEASYTDCRAASSPICFFITSEELKTSQSWAFFSTLHFLSGWLNEGKDLTREHPWIQRTNSGLALPVPCVSSAQAARFFPWYYPNIDCAQVPLK